MFDEWLGNFIKKETNLIIVGCSAVLWALWRARNERCFNETNFNDPTNVLFLCCF